VKPISWGGSPLLFLSFPQMALIIAGKKAFEMFPADGADYRRKKSL